MSNDKVIDIEKGSRKAANPATDKFGAVLIKFPYDKDEITAQDIIDKLNGFGIDEEITGFALLVTTENFVYTTSQQKNFAALLGNLEIMKADILLQRV